MKIHNKFFITVNKNIYSKNVNSLLRQFRTIIIKFASKYFTDIQIPFTILTIIIIHISIICYNDFHPLLYFISYGLL